MIPPAELVGAFLGILFLSIGIASGVAASLRAHTHDRALSAFGSIAVLYGVRLLVRSAVIHAVIPWPLLTWQYADAFLTYAILVPLAILGEALLGRGWRQSLRRLWQLNLAFAVGAIAYALLTGEPRAAMPLNPILLVTNIAIAAPHAIVRLRATRVQRETWIALGGVLTFIVTALFETLSEYQLLGEGVDVEPLTMLILVSCVGYAVAHHVFGNERRLAVVARELEMARRIQHSILPAAPPAFDGAIVVPQYLPMTEVAGDFYDFATIEGVGFAVLVADVSGHGVPAALVASMVKIAFASEAEHVADPAVVLTRMNRALYGKFELAYVTGALGFFDMRSRQLRYASAGHPPILLCRDGEEPTKLEERNLVLGLMPEVSYSSADVSLRPGDRLVFYTDGVLEASSPSGAFFGDERFAEYLRETHSAPTERLASDMVREIRRWTGSADAPLGDDVTLVVIDVK